MTTQKFSNHLYQIANDLEELRIEAYNYLDDDSLSEDENNELFCLQSKIRKMARAFSDDF